MKKFLTVLLSAIICVGAVALVGCDSSYSGNYTEATAENVTKIPEYVNKDTFLTVELNDDDELVSLGLKWGLNASLELSAKYGNSSIETKDKIEAQIAASYAEEKANVTAYAKGEGAIKAKGDLVEALIGNALNDVSLNGEFYLNTDEALAINAKGKLSSIASADVKAKYDLTESELSASETLLYGVEKLYDLNNMITTYSSYITPETATAILSVIKNYGSLSIDASNGLKLKFSLSKELIENLASEYVGGMIEDLEIKISAADIYVSLDKDGVFNGLKVDINASATATAPKYDAKDGFSATEKDKVSVSLKLAAEIAPFSGEVKTFNYKDYGDLAPIAKTVMPLLGSFSDFGAPALPSYEIGIIE